MEILTSRLFLRWTTCFQGWTCELVNLDCWPDQLKTGTVPVFNLNFILKNKSQRQNHIQLNYIVMQSNFAPHLPLKGGCGAQ